MNIVSIKKEKREQWDDQILIFAIIPLKCIIAMKQKVGENGNRKNSSCPRCDDLNIENKEWH